MVEFDAVVEVAGSMMFVDVEASVTSESAFISSKGEDNEVILGKEERGTTRCKLEGVASLAFFTGPSCSNSESS